MLKASVVKAFAVKTFSVKASIVKASVIKAFAVKAFAGKPRMPTRLKIFVSQFFPILIPINARGFKARLHIRLQKFDFALDFAFDNEISLCI